MSRLHPVFNVVKLLPAPSDPIPGRRPNPPPPPEIIDGEEEWIVEEILDSKVMNRKLRYLVKWEGFGVEHNSWEPWDNVHALELIMEFYRRHPGAARYIRTVDFSSIPFRPVSPCIVPRHHIFEGGVDVRGHSDSRQSPLFLLVHPFRPYHPSHPSDLHILFLLFTFHLTIVDRPPIPSVPSALSFIVVNCHGLCRLMHFTFPFLSIAMHPLFKSRYSI